MNLEMLSFQIINYKHFSFTTEFLNNNYTDRSANEDQLCVLHIPI